MSNHRVQTSTQEQLMRRGIPQIENKRLGKLMADLWFHRLEEMPHSRVDATRKQRTLYYMSLDDFQKVHDQIEAPYSIFRGKSEESVHCSEFLSTRFLFYVARELSYRASLTLYDLFHGEKREIFNPEASVYSGNFATTTKFYFIDGGRAITTSRDTIKNADYFVVSLLAINIDTLKYSKLHTKSFEYKNQVLFLDATNRRTFVIYDSSNKTLQLGRIQYIQLEIDEYPLDSDFGPQINYFCFSNSRLTGMSTTLPAGFYEIQIDFETGVMKPQKLFDVENKSSVKNPSEWNHVCFVPKAPCYYMARQSRPNRLSILCRLDTETHELREISCFTFQQILAVHVDEDEILSVCAEEHDNRCKVFRMPLRKPEKLVTISLLEAKRNLFYDNNSAKYARIISILPTQSKPFSLDF